MRTILTLLLFTGGAFGEVEIKTEIIDPGSLSNNWQAHPNMIRGAYNVPCDWTDAKIKAFVEPLPDSEGEWVLLFTITYKDVPLEPGTFKCQGFETHQLEVNVAAFGTDWKHVIPLKGELTTLEAAVE